MWKILIICLSLLLLSAPFFASAEEITFSADTDLTINGVTVQIMSGSTADQMVVNEGNAVFTLAANSALVIRSTNKYTLTCDTNGYTYTCGSSYSEMSITGSNMQSLTVTVGASSATCAAAVSPSGGGVSTASAGTTGAGATPTTPTAPTTTTGQVTATASAGGKTTLTTADGTKATAELPASAVSASTVVKVESEEKATAIDSRPLPADKSFVGSYAYDFTATANSAAVTSFSKNVTLTFTYQDSDIVGLSESTLKVYYWNESSSQWVALTTTVNTASNTLTATTDHFTYFAIMGSAGEETTTGTSGDTIIFDGDLIRNPSAEGMAQFNVYIVKMINGKSFKRLIVSPHVFESYQHFDKNSNGSPWDDVKDVGQATMDQYVVSDLARAVGDTKVYQLSGAEGSDTGVKQWLNMTASQFLSAGYDADSIYEINAVDRDAYTVAADITSA